VNPLTGESSYNPTEGLFVEEWQKKIEIAKSGL